MWTNAVTVDVCKECGEDIEPGAKILRTLYVEAPEVLTRAIHYSRAILCESCGKLYEDSQNLGNG